MGAQAFTLEALEELEQKLEQSQAEFMDDLKTLEQLWRDKSCTLIIGQAAVGSVSQMNMERTGMRIVYPRTMWTRP